MWKIFLQGATNGFHLIIIKKEIFHHKFVLFVIIFGEIQMFIEPSFFYGKNHATITA